MEAPANTRRRGREWALQMIVQADLNPFVKPEMILAHFWEQQWSCRQESEGKKDDDMDIISRNLDPAERLATDAIKTFTEELFLGVIKHLAELDEALAPYCLHWSIDRLGVIERNVLRLGFYEMKYAKTPAPVVINEAVDLAKYFSNVESGSIVNGILDRYRKDLAQK